MNYQDELEKLFKDIQIPNVSKIVSTLEGVATARLEDMDNLEGLTDERKAELEKVHQELKDAISISKTDIKQAIDKINSILND
jgi:hypothetical protein